MTTRSTSCSLGCDARDRITTLLTEIGDQVSRHDRVSSLIYALIEEGICTGTRIIDYVGDFGFNRRHGAIILRTGTGTGPRSGLWSRSEDGIYSSI